MKQPCLCLKYLARKPRYLRLREVCLKQVCRLSLIHI